MEDKIYKRKALGKGLSSLIPEYGRAKGVEEDNNRTIFLCGIDKIVPSRFQPRERFTLEKLEELASSIKQKGVLQPIIVRKSSDQEDKYEIVAGERRWKAAQIAGLKEVPVIVRELSDKEAIEMALVENLQRDDLNPIEEAKAYKWLIESFNYTQNILAERIGKDRSTIANRLRLLSLPDKIKEYLLEGKISEGHARTLLALEDKELMIEVADDIIKNQLSVRETEKLVKKLLSGKIKEERRKVEESPQVKYIVKKLQESLGAKVELKDKKGKGKIVIYYHSYEELDGILDKIIAGDELGI